jgi:YegS/Rv2252/BmrU family lipid kinase
MSSTPIKIIVSAGAGRGNNREVCDRLTAIFNENQTEIDMSLAHSGAEVTELARNAARDAYKVVVAAGGDGTVNSVASAVVESDKILGILPLGTLNHFARDMKIPFDLEAAAKTIVAGHTTEIDVAEVNNRIFVNNSSLGLYPIIVREREKRERLGLGRWRAFVWAVIQALRRYPFLDVRVRVDDEFVDQTTPFVFIGNNEYAMESFNIGLRDRLDRGVLSIYITQRTTRLQLIILALRAVIGRLRDDKDFLAFSSKHVRIETHHRRLRVAFDGEIDVMEPPLQYRVRTRALRVIVPKQSEAE